MFPLVLSSEEENEG